MSSALYREPNTFVLAFLGVIRLENSSQITDPRLRNTAAAALSLAIVSWQLCR